MGRRKINEEELKAKLSIRINSKLFDIVNETISNKSKYIEWLINQDLNKNNQIKNM